MDFKKIITEEYKKDFDKIADVAVIYLKAYNHGDIFLLDYIAETINKFKNDLIDEIKEKYGLIKDDFLDDMYYPEELYDTMDELIDDIIDKFIRDPYQEVAENPGCVLILEHNGKTLIDRGTEFGFQKLKNEDGNVVIQGDVVGGKISSVDIGEKGIRKAINDLYDLGYRFRINNRTISGPRETPKKINLGGE